MYPPENVHDCGTAEKLHHGTTTFVFFILSIPTWYSRCLWTCRSDPNKRTTCWPARLILRFQTNPPPPISRWFCGRISLFDCEDRWVDEWVAGWGGEVVVVVVRSTTGQYQRQTIPMPRPAHFGYLPTLPTS